MALRGVLAQEIHHRVKNNLQTVASLLRLQARAEGVDPTKALGDSVNRILAIAAVHEELTEHREDVVDLAELVDRLRATLVQGLVAGKEVAAELEPVELAGQRATALALVFSELLSNALEHGGDHVSIAARTRAATATRARGRRRRDGHVDVARSCATSSGRSSIVRGARAEVRSADDASALVGRATRPAAPTVRASRARDRRQDDACAS